MSTEFEAELAAGAEQAASAPADAVIERMKKVAECDTDASLATAINTSRSNIAKWRKRNSVPYMEVFKFSVKYKTSVDYLLTGQRLGHEFLTIKVIDDNILSILLKQLFAKSLLFHPKGFEPNDYAKWLARRIASRYNDVEELIEKLQTSMKMSRRDAEEAAIVAAETIFLGRSSATDQAGGNEEGTEP
ncbi:MAG: hypothetical protein C3F11_08350 [Methylocystaceae bacterium]|nr:MAG: hypothetical protein C3F11_08350 [Methylocystaceae bacterium]